MTIKSLSPIFIGLLAVLSLTIMTTQVGAQTNTIDCATEYGFLSVEADPANSDYTDPMLSVSCADDTMTIVSNGIPNYEFLAITPGNLREQDLIIEIPLNPTFAEETTDVALLGETGIAVNGLPIFGPNEGGNLGFGDPVLDQILDFCNGHVGPSGYHLHAAPTCIFDNYESANLVIGYALDGFPILAPYVCADDACNDVTEVNSSWQRTSDVISAWDAHEYIAGSGDLDQCNGMFLEDGSYAYFATNSFPYTVSCYVGEVTLPQTGGQDGQGGTPPTGEQGGQDGNTDAPPTGQNTGAPPNGEGGQGGQGGNRPPRGQGRGGN